MKIWLDIYILPLPNPMPPQGPADGPMPHGGGDGTRGPGGPPSPGAADGCRPYGDSGGPGGPGGPPARNK